MGYASLLPQTTERQFVVLPVLMRSYLPQHGEKRKQNKASAVDFEKLTSDGMLVVVMFADNSFSQQNLFLCHGMLRLVEYLLKACCV